MRYKHCISDPVCPIFKMVDFNADRFSKTLVDFTSERSISENACVKPVVQ